MNHRDDLCADSLAGNHVRFHVATEVPLVIIEITQHLSIRVLKEESSLVKLRTRNHDREERRHLLTLVILLEIVVVVTDGR